MKSAIAMSGFGPKSCEAGFMVSAIARGHRKNAAWPSKRAGSCLHCRCRDLPLVGDVTFAVSLTAVNMISKAHAAATLNKLYAGASCQRRGRKLMQLHMLPSLLHPHITSQFSQQFFSIS